MKQVAEDLKTEFEAEGALDIYNHRIMESEHVLKFVETGRTSRFLYHVKSK